MWFGQTGSNVAALCFAPDGRTLYTGGPVGELRVWDVVSHAVTELPSYNRSVEALWAIDERLVVSTWNAVWTLNLRTGVWATPLAPKRPLHSPSLSADGRVVADCGGGRPRFWDAHTRRALRVPREVAAIEQATVSDFTADGSGLLLYSSESGRAWIWDLAGKKMRCELDPEPAVIYPWALSRDGRTAAISRAPRILIYDLTTGKRRAPMVKGGHAALALDPSGQTLAVASSAQQGTVGLWDTATGRVREQFAWRVGRLSCLTFSPDGLTCAAGCETGVVVWDVGG